MTADNPSRRIIALLAVVGVVLAGAIALGTWRPWAPIAEAPAVAAPQQPVAPLPAALALPEDPEVLIFGDSWTYGSAATDPAGGYAYRVGEKLGWRTTVDGGRGSGYLKPGIDGPSYGDRIAALGERGLHPDLVVLQGSINDRRQDLDGYDAAVTAAWDELAATFPEAQIVVLGPAPHVLPVASGIPQLDRSLAALAEARGWWYISPLAEEWITEANYASLIDTTEVGRNHPSDAGHAYLADRVVEALERIRQPVAVTATDEDPQPAMPDTQVDGAPAER